LKTWYDDLQKATLSEYGCRRLMEAIKWTVWSRNKDKLNNFSKPNAEVRILRHGEPAFPCPRCTRLHQGGPDNCRSKNMVCKRCGVIGHFVDVHDVEDAEFRKLIVQTLEVDVFGTTPVDVNAPLEAPQPAPMPNMDSWYQ